MSQLPNAYMVGKLCNAEGMIGSSNALTNTIGNVEWLRKKSLQDDHS